MGLKEDILFLEIVFFWGGAQRSCEGRGVGAQRPVWGGNELKKTSARSARARTRGQNPLVVNIVHESLDNMCIAVRPRFFLSPA